MAQQNEVTVEIEDETTENNTSARRNIVFVRLDSLSRPMVVNRNNIGLSDRINNVFREIRPIVENARMGTHGRLSLPSWLPRNPGGTSLNAEPSTRPVLQRPHSTIAHIEMGPTTQAGATDSAIIPQRQMSRGLSSSASNESNLSEQAHDPSEGNGHQNNNNENADNSQSDDDLQQVVDIRATLNLLIRYAPFYFILFIKFLYDSREGIFTFLILFCAFSHSNTLVRREHGKQLERSGLALLTELALTVGVVGVVHAVFGRGRLLPNLVMFPAYAEPIALPELLWLVVLTDLIVRILTVDIKILLTLLPACVLPIQKRGKVYLFVEAVSQLYRALLPIQPWVFYLVQSYEGSEKMVGMFLCSIYAIAKVIEIVMRLRLVQSATWTLVQSVSLGSKPTGEQLGGAGDACPICHDAFRAPVRLHCSHIFCELCIAAWLDRDYTCPLCRAKVADEPTWRDGSTTYEFQLY